ncbi:MAG: germination protein YpeB [Clostridia bacterium]|nr:germination protein YpeB [Clostridia bacterium]
MKKSNKIEEKIEKTTTKRDLGEDITREKKMSTAQKTLPILIIACVALLIALGAVLIAFYQLKKTNDQSAKTLESVYSGSYYSMVDSVNNLQVNADKFETLTSSSSQRAVLKDMEQDCAYIVASLSVLPVDADNSNSAIKFFNQVSGMCEAYITTIDNGKSLTSEQLILVDKAEYALSIIKSKLNTHNEMVRKGEYRFVAAGVFDDEGVTQFSSSIGDLTADEVDYPTMIFDGPFSASLENKKINGLSENEITMEEAYEYLKNVVYKDQDVKIEYLQETVGDFVTYDFSVVKNDIDYYAQVTRRQGLLLTLSGYVETEEPSISSEKAQELAESFAEQVGFGRLITTWLEVKGNIAYINLAPTQEGVVLYPDLVKVKVDMYSQSIVGFEAKNYALNHTERKFKTSIELNEAEKELGFDYIILNTRKAIIVLENEVEVAVYEFACERMGGLYYYYVDANTGKIVEILKVVDSNGTPLLV